MQDSRERQIKIELLLKSAARLYSLGVDLDGARERVRTLAASGVSCDDPELVNAVNEYSEIKSLWDALEKEHLSLRDELDGKN